MTKTVFQDLLDLDFGRWGLGGATGEGVTLGVPGVEAIGRRVPLR